MSPLDDGRVRQTGGAAGPTARDDRAAVDKAISLLTSFGPQAASGLGVSELARRASLSKSTAFRVLGMLERNGVVERIGSDYRLGARLHELGRAAYAGHDRTRDRLIPFLTDLYEATRETVHLAALHGVDVVCLAKIYGHRQRSVSSGLGGRMPAYTTSAGKALLAYDADVLELTPHDVSADLEEVRRLGVAVQRSVGVPGVSSIAAPVFGPSGRPVAALSVSVPQARTDRRSVERSLRQITGAATRQLRRGPSRPW